MKLYRLLYSLLLILGGILSLQGQVVGTPYFLGKTTTLVTALNCGSATQSGTLSAFSPASGVTVTVPYTGGNGKAYTSYNINSTGVTGLTASATAGNIAIGNGSLVFTISGTPATSGTASFDVSLGGKSCSFTASVNCPTPIITSQPTSAAVTAGASNTFSVSATGAGLTYQWMLNGSPISGANSNTYTTSVTGTYSVEVTNLCGAKVTSNSVTLTTSCVAPVITAQPVNGYVTSPTTYTFSVTATGTGLAYQWYKDGSSISGANSSTYNTGISGTYVVIITNSCGTVFSNFVTLTVCSGPPVITSQPANATVTAPATNTFSVTATGTGLTYQWYNTITGIIAGAVSTTYTTDIAGTYNVKVTNTCNTAVTSNNATLTVNTCTVTTPSATVVQPTCANGTKGTITITSQAGAEYSINSGASYQASNVFSNLSPGSYSLRKRMTATPTCVSSIISQVLNDPGTCCTVVAPSTLAVTQPSCFNGKVGQIVFSPQSNAEYSINNGSSYQASTAFLNLNPGTYTLKVRGTLDASCLSSTINVVLTDPGTCCIAPSIISHPVSGTTNGVNNYTFSVSATGTGLTYQWRRDGVNISGANASSYSTNIPATYSVFVSGTCGNATSGNATLTNPCTTGTVSTFTASAPYVYNPNGASSHYVTTHNGVNTDAITWSSDGFTFNCAGTYTIEGDIVMTLGNPGASETSVRLNGMGEMGRGTQHFTTTKYMNAGESHYFWTYVTLGQGMSFIINNGKITKIN